MRVNRKALEAENRQLREQLAVSGHTTRKALNAYVQSMQQENKELKKQLAAANKKIAELTSPAQPPEQQEVIPA